VKKSRLGRGTKALHLTYLGDATLGENANIGANQTSRANVGLQIPMMIHARSMYNVARLFLTSPPVQHLNVDHGAGAAQSS